MFEITPTNLNGAVVLTPPRHSDARGEFVKTFHASAFADAGLDLEIRETFFSVSSKSTIRGMHFQSPPYAHSKLVYCAMGKILDVILDLRKNSPTYGKAFSLELRKENRKMLFIPVGFAHGFLSLEHGSITMYQTSLEHMPQHDCGIHWQSFGFDWPCANPILSERDKKHPPLAGFISPF